MRASNRPLRSLGLPKMGSNQSLISELVTEFSELDIDAEKTAARTSPRKPVLVLFTTNVMSASSPLLIGVAGGECEKNAAIATPMTRKNANWTKIKKPLIPSAQLADDRL